PIFRGGLSRFGDFAKGAAIGIANAGTGLVKALAYAQAIGTLQLWELPLINAAADAVHIEPEGTDEKAGGVFVVVAAALAAPEATAERVVFGAGAFANAETFAAHAAWRADLGLPAIGAEGAGTLARLEAGGQEFWGINAHGQSIAPLRVNAISA